MFSMSTFEANAEGNQPDNNVVIVKSPWVKRTPKRQQPIYYLMFIKQVI